MMQESEKRTLIDKTCLCDLVLRAKQINRTAEEAQSFKGLCRQMGKQVCELSQMLNTLCCFITLNLSLLTHLNPIHCVITAVSNVLRKTLTLARTCKSKTTIIYRPFNGTDVTRSQFHDLYDRLDFLIANISWLLILYNPDFGSAFDDIFLSLPQTLSNSSFCDLQTLSLVVTEKLVCKLSTMLKSGTYPFELKICCAEALSMLNVGSAISSRVIDQEKTLRELMLGLAELVEAECGPEVQYNCLMSITEITATVESDPDLRCKVIKTNSLAAKAIVDQLLKVSKESVEPTLQVLAIKSIGSLARIFRRGDKHVIGVLVSQLGNRHQEVVMEALVALQKFACGHGNFLGKAHSNTMIEFHAVQHMMILLRDFERTEKLQLRALVLICDLALNADYSKVMEEARVRTFLQQLSTTKGGSFDSELKELVSKALLFLTLYYES